jgi:hypothetical protein
VVAELLSTVGEAMPPRWLSPNRTPSYPLISTRKEPWGVMTRRSTSFTEPSSAMNSTFDQAR